MNRGHRYQKSNHKNNRNYKQNTHHNSKTNVKNYNVVLEDLQDYMLQNENMEKYRCIINTNYKTIDKTVKKNKKIINSVKDTNTNTDKPKIFFAKQKDTLFWCFFIIYKGRENYDMIINKHFQEEKSFKITAAEYARECKDRLKEIKVKRVDMESELVNDSKISLLTFLGLCYIYNKNVIVIKNNIYYEINAGTHEELFSVVTCKNNGVDDIYGIETDVDDATISAYRKDLYKIENISKPIRAFSYYKLEDLCVICQKLKISTTITVNDKTKSKSKKMLYENIVQQI